MVVSGQMLDAWGAYPMDLTSIDPPPAEWWCPIVETPSGDGPVQVGSLVSGKIHVI
jgi:hypothetical protein